MATVDREVVVVAGEGEVVGGVPHRVGDHHAGVTGVVLHGVVLVGEAQLDLFIIALSKAPTAVICFLVLFKYYIYSFI